MARSATYGLEICAEPPSNLFEKRSRTDIRSQIWSTINKMTVINSPGYHATSAIFLNPGLYIEEHGFIGLPLSSSDADIIMSKAKQSHRKIWELDATQITFKNPEWEKAVQTMFLAANQKMDMVTDAKDVSVDLHKLMLCEPGSHYKQLKPSEKESEENEPSGVFGILAVFLPSPHKGGGFELENSKTGHRFETDDRCEFDITFAAWYSDLDEKMFPIASGSQLILKYNLALRSRPDLTSLPSTTGARTHLQLLSQLLQEYNWQLEKGDSKIQPYLLHQLENEYSNDGLGSPCLEYMHGHDVLHVEYFSEIATKLDYSVYLARSELCVTKQVIENRRYYRYEYGYEDDDLPTEAEEIDRTITLTCLREPEGKLIRGMLVLNDDVFISPQYCDKGDPAREEQDDPDDDGTAQRKYYYDNVVVLLVPPCRKMDFLLSIDQDQTEVLPLIRNLRRAVVKDRWKKPQLERLCTLLLRESQGYESTKDPISLNGVRLKPSLVAELLEQVSSALLEIGRLDSFNELSFSTSGEIITSNASLIAIYAVQMGLDAMRVVLEQGVRGATEMKTKLEFIKEVQDGFESYGTAPESVDIDCESDEIEKTDNTEIKNVRIWLEKMLLETITEREYFCPPESKSLAENRNRFNETIFKGWVEFDLLTSTTSNKVAYLLGIAKSWREDTKDLHHKFRVDLINSVWNNFEFDPYFDHTMDYSYSPWEVVRDTVHITKEFMPHMSFINDMIPCFVKAAPSSTSKTAHSVFVSLIGTLVEGKDPYICQPDKHSPPPVILKKAVQILLKHFIETNVGPDPKKHKTWKLPRFPTCDSAKSYSCKDCPTVNDFLASERITLEIAAVEPRRKHLDRIFKYSRNTSFEVETIKDGSPHKWRITKHQREHEAEIRKWQGRVAEAKTVLQAIALPNQHQQIQILHTYLDPYWDAFMEARVESLPDIQWSEPLAEIGRNVRSYANTSPGAKKRTHDQDGIEDDGPSKRTRSAVHDSENGIHDDENNANTGIVDLTDS